MDSWEIINGGRPLKGGVSGYPVLLRSPYSAGNLYVLNIPDDFGNLYDYPEKTLNQIRKIMSRDLGIWFEGPAKVSLFVYDNNTFIIESYQDEPVTVRIHIEGNKITLQDILTAEIMVAEAQSAHTNPEFRSDRVHHDFIIGDRYSEGLIGLSGYLPFSPPRRSRDRYCAFWESHG